MNIQMFSVEYLDLVKRNHILAVIKISMHRIGDHKQLLIGVLTVFLDHRIKGVL